MCREWKGTSLKINDESSSFFEKLEQEGISIRREEEILLENQRNHFIYEDEFIEQSKNLNIMISKYKNKEYSDKSKRYLSKENKFEKIQCNSDDLNKYQKVCKQNVIDGDIREFNISINMLNKIFDDSQKSRLFLDILIMFALGNRVSYTAEDFEIEFNLDDVHFKEKFNILTSKPIDLYQLYDWIFNDEEYKDSYTIKLQIVRQVIIKRRNIIDASNILTDSKLAYTRIISKKTDDYFEQLNRLKDDFLVLSKNENGILRTLNITFFAWLGYLWVEIYRIIVNYDKSDIFIYLFCSTGAKKGLVILGFTIALIFIFFAYAFEMKSLKKTYTVIKKIYKDKILFEDDMKEDGRFESSISEPKVGKIQLGFFLVVLTLLLYRLYKSFPW